MNFLKKKIKSYLNTYIDQKLSTLLSSNNKLSTLHLPHGNLKSSLDCSYQDKLDASLHFQHREKAEVALSVASFYSGGDYMEFGSSDLATYGNFLTAFDIFRLGDVFPDTHFYGFDIFGDDHTDSEETRKKINSIDYKGYFEPHYKEGGGLSYEEHLKRLKDRGLFLDRCHLIKGYFEDTLTDKFKNDYLKQGRRVGFAFLDCNLAPPYRLVFEFLIDVINTNCAYIYMDEYYTPFTPLYFDQFVKELNKRHGMNVRMVRNAAGFGALFYLHGPLHEPHNSPLNFGSPSLDSVSK